MQLCLHDPPIYACIRACTQNDTFAHLLLLSLTFPPSMMPWVLNVLVAKCRASLKGLPNPSKASAPPQAFPDLTRGPNGVPGPPTGPQTFEGFPSACQALSQCLHGPLDFPSASKRVYTAAKGFAQPPRCWHHMQQQLRASKDAQPATAGGGVPRAARRHAPSSPPGCDHRAQVLAN